MITDKLGLAAPADISARMDLINSKGDVVYVIKRNEDGEILKDDKGDPVLGEAGWIEFWGPEAEPVRRFRRELETESFIKGKREQRKGIKVPSPAEAEREIEEAEQTVTDGLACRVKAWRLVTGDGRVLEDQATTDAARALFSHPGYRFLKIAAVQFCGDSDNFFTESPAN